MNTDPEETVLRAELAEAAAAHLTAQAWDHPETPRFTAARMGQALLDLSHHQDDLMSAAWRRTCEARRVAAPDPETSPPEPEAHL